MLLLFRRFRMALPHRLKPWLLHSMALTSALAGLGVVPLAGTGRALALNEYCQVTEADALAKEDLRKALFAGDTAAEQPYQDMVQQHTEAMRDCRSRSWPQHQAIWLRLYPCDLQPGILDAMLDRVVNLGYNQVYVEAFYGGQVLLPEADNPPSGRRWCRPWLRAPRSVGRGH
jgi:hypothetical protein